MNPSNLISGMIIIGVHHKPEDNFVVAEHDQIYCSPTFLPIQPKDVEQLLSMGWYQEGQPEMNVSQYDRSKSWIADV